MMEELVPLKSHRGHDWDKEMDVVMLVWKQSESSLGSEGNASEQRVNTKEHCLFTFEVIILLQKPVSV